MVIKKEIIDVQRLAISSEVKDAVKNKKYGSSELINYLNKFKSFNEKEVYALIVVDTKGRYVGGFKEDVERTTAMRSGLRIPSITARYMLET